MIVPEIRLDSARIERIVSQILRDDARLSPLKANELAALICIRLSTSMPMPTNPYLSGYRIIRSRPPFDGTFTKAVGAKLADVNDAVAWELWDLVYERGHDLPPAVADLPSWQRS
ncbi:hypothetical protein E4K64_15185 [Bradyrhizobium frederickii]|uniref:Uncharacterized protein n=1 Tax=Bradyrhizobium frederickii TaxID=2560054 RepID=A0A4Y9P402_9BRAD|nr:hypothetical protein [Bradyrhizobium frederickii]TFV75069.1 hypothetical protein E4K64_15185 [Bradyrhizobium frederickii]